MYFCFKFLKVKAILILTLIAACCGGPACLLLFTKQVFDLFFFYHFPILQGCDYLLGRVIVLPVL